jgi:cytochrome b subunit of formate dehydrogenase
MPTHATPESTQYYLRIGLYHRILHGMLITAFLGLAGTGLPIKFNWAPWASSVAQTIGGFGTLIFFHQSFALLLTLCFALHIGSLVYRGFIKGDRSLFWGSNSLVPNPKDFIDLYAHFRWFLGLGPRPHFDRFTYWEKFDYWAVFWGMAIIGTSGFMLWFSSFFARFTPGWLFNIALLIHSDEALLAVWFIFAIHFFNSHIRPEKFPMDPVIFTGRISAEELQEERPAEFARLVTRDKLQTLAMDPPPLWLRNFGRIIGFTAVGIGWLLFGLTIMAF